MYGSSFSPLYSGKMTPCNFYEIDEYSRCKRSMVRSKTSMKKDESTPAAQGDLHLVHTRLQSLEVGAKKLQRDSDYLAELVMHNGVRIDCVEDRCNRLDEKVDKGFAEIQDILKPMSKHLLVLYKKAEDHEKALEEMST